MTSKEQEAIFTMNNGIVVKIRKNGNSIIFDIDKLCIISVVGGSLPKSRKDFPNALEVTFKQPKN